VKEATEGRWLQDISQPETTRWPSIAELAPLAYEEYFSKVNDTFEVKDWSVARHRHSFWLTIVVTVEPIILGYMEEAKRKGDPVGLLELDSKFVNSIASKLFDVSTQIYAADPDCLRISRSVDDWMGVAKLLIKKLDVA
jgi:hypothetical protein